MANAQGFSETLLMGAEATFKTLPGTPPAFKIPVINPQIKPNVNKFTSKALTGSAQPRPTVYGKVGVGGSFDLESSRESLAPPLKGLFGQVTDTTGVTGFYTHSYTLASTLNSWGLEEGHADIAKYVLWSGGRIGMAKFDFAAEGLMQVNFGFQGAYQNPVAGTSAFTGTITDLTGSQPISYVSATVKQGGTSITIFENISVTFDRKLQPVMTMDGTNQASDIIQSDATELSGTFKALFPDSALIDLSIAGTETSLEILCPAPESGHGFMLFMPTVKFSPAAPSTNGLGLNTVDISFDGYSRGLASNVPGEAWSKYATTFTIGAGTTDSLKIKVDGAAAQTITLTSGSRTPAQIVTDINATLTGALASVVNGRVRIASSQVTLLGSASSIQIDATGTAQTPLGFDTQLHPGFSSQALVCTLFNATVLG